MRLLRDPLPAEIRRQVVDLPSSWNADEAASLKGAA